MTSNEIVTQVRNRLNKLNPELSFQDKDIWKEFSAARTRVYKNELNKRNSISQMAYHTVCLELVDAPEDCPCKEIGCNTKKTKYQIPSYLERSSNSTLQIYSPANTRISIGTIDTVEDDIKYKSGYKNKPIASISNGFLNIHNSNLNNIKIKAIFSDPLELLFIQDCSTDNCLKDNKELIQIEETLLLDMINVTVNSLYPSIQIPEDTTGDNNAKV